MDKKIFLSVVIPAYNEEKNIKAGALKEVFDYLKRQKYSWEVLLVDDGSKDSTVSLLTQFCQKHKGLPAGRQAFKVLKEPHRGKAGTVIAGVLASVGDIVLFTDMDQATPIHELEKILPKFEDGYDIAIGSRLGREGYPFIRKTMAYGFMILRTIILKLPYKDTQCGFKAFKKQVAKEIFKRMQVFKENAKMSGASVKAGFDLEILYIARKLNYKVAEVTVDWHEKNLRREVNPIKDSYEGLRDLLRVRKNAIMGKYKL